MAKVEITQDLLNKYKNHPRLLEVRLILLFDIFEREFGYMNVMNIFDGLCSGFGRSKELIDTVLNKRFDIKRKSKTTIDSLDFTILITDTIKNKIKNIIFCFEKVEYLFCKRE